MSNLMVGTVPQSNTPPDKRNQTEQNQSSFFFFKFGHTERKGLNKYTMKANLTCTSVQSDLGIHHLQCPVVDIFMMIIFVPHLFFFLILRMMMMS